MHKSLLSVLGDPQPRLESTASDRAAWGCCPTAAPPPGCCGFPPLGAGAPSEKSRRSYAVCRATPRSFLLSYQKKYMFFCYPSCLDYLSLWFYSRASRAAQAQANCVKRGAVGLGAGAAPAPPGASQKARPLTFLQF